MQLTNYIENKLSESSSIYFHREVLAYSLEGRKVELLTITSHHGKSDEYEDLLPDLFPEHMGKYSLRP
jgi:hypothetical protein